MKEKNWYIFGEKRARLRKKYNDKGKITIELGKIFFLITLEIDETHNFLVNTT